MSTDAATTPPLSALGLAIDPTIIGLGAALAIGLLIGLERGWQEREQADGSRVAGLRTFALIGLLGGVLATLPRSFGPWPLGAGLLGLALLAAVSYQAEVGSSGKLSVTSSVAALLTYGLGALAASGAPALATGVAVIAAVLLDLKSTLHRWLRHVEHRELSAALQMLVLSVVVLPLLPDHGYGPYAALNPYRLWWAVVLVSGLSLAGHVAMRLSGPQRGLLWTGLLGGLASSTAATLTLSRRTRQEPQLAEAAAAGTLAACGVMFVRMDVIVLMLQPALGQALAGPLLASGAVLLVLGVRQWRHHAPAQSQPTPDEVAPFDLSVAVGFGAFLGLMAVLSRAAHDWLGDSGLYGLAVLSGLADVDAIVISVSRLQAGGGLSVTAAGLAIGLAATSNMLVKAGMAWFTGGSELGRRVVIGYSAALTVGGLAIALTMLT
ncbi:MAG: MgtC/SapB family protein [Leptothrix sp. (in: b-proteobacteria)]